jgi:hypothetical protein
MLPHRRARQTQERSRYTRQFPLEREVLALSLATPCEVKESHIPSDHSKIENFRSCRFELTCSER